MRRSVIEWLVTLAVAAAAVLAIEVEVAQPFRVPTSSMEPTLRCAHPGSGCTGRLNDRVVVAKIVYRFRDPRRGEIAVFHAPDRARVLCSEGGTYLKRVIGIPGDVLAVRDGVFYVNGRRLAEPYVSPHDRDVSETRSWPRLEPDQYFVAGDNRAASCDSRRWGPVSRSAFVGPVVATYWPPTRWTVR